MIGTLEIVLICVCAALVIALLATCINNNCRRRNDYASFSGTDIESNVIRDEVTILKSQMQTLADENEKLSDENKRLSSRVAADMDIKIAASESQFENINIPSRPLKIQEKYDLLFANSWTDAKTAIDEQPQPREEKWKVAFLLGILTTAYDNATLLFAKKKTQIALLLTNPDIPLQVLVQEKVGDEPENIRLSEELMIRVTDTLKRNAMDAKLDYLEKEIISKLAVSEDHATVLGLNEVKEYLSECTNLAWNMVIQRPPMNLVCTELGTPWKSGIQEVELMWYARPFEPEATVKYVKKPIMYHGGRCVSKGEVYVD